MEAILYARVSTQRQTQSQSIDGQIERLFAHAATQGLRVMPEAVFRDDGYSGSSLLRPGLDRLRDLVQAGRVGRVLVTAPDRLARNYVHQVLLVEELQKHGAQVDFLDRPMSSDPHDQLLLQIRGAVAEYERALIAERTRRGRLRKLKAGLLLPWTKPPYGYRLDPDHPRDPAGVRINEAEAAVVRDIYAWYAEDGLSLTGLVKRLRGHGIASPMGRPLWSTAALHLMLTNPVYTGRVVANRYRVPPAQKRRSALAPVGRGRDGNKRATSPDEWIEVGVVPAIITQDQHDRAVALQCAHGKAQQHAPLPSTRAGELRTVPTRLHRPPPALWARLLSLPHAGAAA